MDIQLSKEEVYFAVTAYLYMRGLKPRGAYNIRLHNEEGLIHIEATDVVMDGNVDVNKVIKMVQEKEF